jgi:hypothetical protein
MRLFITTILILVFAAIGETFCPWWIIIVVSFVFGFMTDLQIGKAFLAGFLGIGVLWLTIALWQDIPNQHILSQKMAMLFHLPHYSLFILVTVLLGGLTGGVSALSGIMLRKIL